MKYTIQSLSLSLGFVTFALLSGCDKVKSDEAVSTTKAAVTATAHEFTCNVKSVQTETLHHNLAVPSGDSLRLGPGQEPCSYSLIYVAADGSRQVLNTAPAMIFLADAVGQTTANGGTVVTACWTEIRHEASQEEHPEEGYANRTMTQTSLQCRTRTVEGWSAPTVVAESSDYASWFSAIAVDSSAPNGVRITWRRDSTFNFAGANGTGRPETDGVYASTVVGGQVTSTVQTDKSVLSVDGTLLAATSGSNGILGFEDPSQWTTTAVKASSTTSSQGAASLSVAARGWTTIVSAPLSSLGMAGSKLALDLSLPTTQSNQYWLGAVQLYASIPSQNLYNAYIGQVELTGQALGQFNTQTFTLSETVRTALSAKYEDLTFTVVLNVPADAVGNYLVDNLRFVD